MVCHVGFSITVPISTYNHLEKIRGEIPRSKFICKLIERNQNSKENENDF